MKKIKIISNEYKYYSVDMIWRDLNTDKIFNSMIIVNAKSEKQVKFLACKVTEQYEELEKGLKVVKFNSIDEMRFDYHRRIRVIPGGTYTNLGECS